MEKNTKIREKYQKYQEQRKIVWNRGKSGIEIIRSGEKLTNKVPYSKVWQGYITSEIK